MTEMLQNPASDSAGPMYAVVDKSKKSRPSSKKTVEDNDFLRYETAAESVSSYNEIPARNEVSAIYDAPASAPTYSVLERSVARARSPEVPPQNDQLSSNYSALDSITEKSETEDPQKMKTRGIIIVGLIALLLIALFIATGVALIVSFVTISELRSAATANSLNIASLVTDIQESRNGIDRLFNNFVNKFNSTGGSSLEAVLVGISNRAGHTFSSCAAIWQLSPSSPSGMYYVRSSNGSAVHVYCDMTRTCGGITGGWMRVAELDITDNTTQCPNSLRLSETPRPTCRTMDSDSALCSSDTFTVRGVGYSKVCGRIIGYQVGTPDAFGKFQMIFNSGRDTDIETYYVDGVSLTHGMTPRQHIWTFVGAGNEDDKNPGLKCPCINTAISSLVPPIPSFVGQDYFCDTARVSGGSFDFFGDDPLWDGAGCGPGNTCCSFNTPPWFFNDLQQPNTDDIEMRLCRDQKTTDEDIAIEVVEIYVQ